MSTRVSVHGLRWTIRASHPVGGPHTAEPGHPAPPAPKIYRRGPASLACTLLTLKDEIPDSFVDAFIHSFIHPIQETPIGCLRLALFQVLGGRTASDGQDPRLWDSWS